MSSYCSLSSLTFFLSDLSFIQVYGELTEGLLVHVSVGKARNLLLPDCAALNCLGKHFAFEAAVGMNGAVWVKAADVMENIIIRNMIINSQYLSDIEVEAMVDVIAASRRQRPNS